jgi:hypothetical protein
MDPRTSNDSATLIAAVKNTAFIGVSRVLCILGYMSVDIRYGLFPQITYLADPLREGKTLVSGKHVCDSCSRSCKTDITCSNESNKCQENKHYNAVWNRKLQSIEKGITCWVIQGVLDARDAEYKCCHSLNQDC